MYGLWKPYKRSTLQKLNLWRCVCMCVCVERGREGPSLAREIATYVTVLAEAGNHLGAFENASLTRVVDQPGVRDVTSLRGRCRGGGISAWREEWVIRNRGGWWICKVIDTWTSLELVSWGHCGRRRIQWEREDQQCCLRTGASTARTSATSFCQSSRAGWVISYPLRLS